MNILHLSHKQGKTIKEVGHKKYELISSHVCRRSFATNMYFGGVDTEIITTNTGHTTLKSLFNYIKITKREKAYTVYDYFSSEKRVIAR